MTNKIKILHLTPEINYSCGISKTIFNIISKVDNKFEQQILTLGGDSIEYFNQRDIKVKCLHIRKRSIFSTIKILKEINKIVRDDEIQIVHSHHRYFDFLAFVLKKINKIQTITSVHSLVKSKIFLSYQSDHLIAVSESVKQHLVNYFKKNEKKITVIYNFIVPENIVVSKTIKQMKDELNIDKKDRIILFVGRLDFEKGIDILIKAFELLWSRQIKNVVLLMVGTGELKEWIYEFVRSRNINIKIAPPTDNPFNYYNIADIVVLPSRVDPFPLVMLETGFAKKAFVDSQVDGIAEYIDENKNGVLVGTEQIEKLAITIEELIKNTQKRAELGQKLYEKVIYGNTDKQIIPKYEEYYSSQIF